MNSATLFFILFGLSVAGVAFILWLMWKEKKHSGSDNPEYDKPLRLSKDVTTSPKHVLERAGLEDAPAIKTSNKDYTAIDRLTGTAAMTLSPDKTSSPPHPGEAAQQSPTHPPPETHPAPPPKRTGAVSPEAELSLQADELKSHLSSLQDKYTQLEKLFDEKSTALDKIQQHLDSELKHRKEFNKIKDILEKEIKDQKDKVKQMQGDLSNAELENQNSTKRIAQLEEKIKLIDSDKLELEAAAKKARMDLEDATRAKDAIEFTIAEKDQKISQLVQRLHDLAAGSSTAVAGLRPDVIENPAEVPEQKETPGTDTRPASTDSEKTPAEAPQDTPEVSGPSDSETAETGAATDLPAEKASKKEDTELPSALPATPSSVMASSEEEPAPAPEPTTEKDEAAVSESTKAAGTQPEEVDAASAWDTAAPDDIEPDHENLPLLSVTPTEDDGATETETEPGIETSDYTLSSPDEARGSPALESGDEISAEQQELPPSEPAAYTLNDSDNPGELPPAGQTATDDETTGDASENDVIWITPDDRENDTEEAPEARRQLLPDTEITKDEEQPILEPNKHPFAPTETDGAEDSESAPAVAFPETEDVPEATEPEDPRDQFGRTEPDMPTGAVDEPADAAVPGWEPPNIFRSQADDDADIDGEGPGQIESPELSTPPDEDVEPEEAPAFRPMALSDVPDSGTEDDMTAEADAAEAPPSLRPDIVPSPKEELDPTLERPGDLDDFSVKEADTHEIREDDSDRDGAEGTIAEISPEPAPDKNSDLAYIEEIDTKLFDDPKPVPEYNDEGAYQLETSSYKLTDEKDTQGATETEEEASEPQEVPFEEALSQFPDEQPETLLDEEPLTEPKPPFEAGQRTQQASEEEPQPSVADHAPDEQQTEKESPGEEPASDVDTQASSPSSLFDASIRNAKQLLSMMEEEDDFSPEESEEEDDQKQNE